MALSQTEFIVDLFLLLAGSLFAGELASRLGQPALVGQLLVGVLLGPTILGQYLGLSTLPPEFSSLQFLATVFILFLAGLETAPEEILRMGALTALLGIAIFVIPFTGLFLVITLLLPGVSILKALFIALTLSITALPVMGIMLAQFGLLHKPIGKFLMNAALINELTAVTVFAVLLELFLGKGTGYTAVGLALVDLFVFLGVMVGIYLGIRLLQRTPIWGEVRDRFARDWRSKGVGFALLMVLLVGASLFSQFLGLTFVVGAFYAGLLVTRDTAGASAHRSISTVFDTISWGFFIPLFFAFVGLQMNLRLVGTPDLILVFGVLLVVAVVLKVLVGDLAGRLRGWGAADARAIGFLVSSRGAVELAMALILLQDGVFDVQLFTIVAGVGLLTTMIAPIGALRAWQSTLESRTELLQRVPSLQGVRGRAWIRTPALAFGDVRDFHSDPSASTSGRTPPATRSTPDSGEGTVKSDPLALPDNPARPPLPAVKRKPPAD
ncbi:MAG: cation:proton antiporter [Thermoplasmata archaeon]